MQGRPHWTGEVRLVEDALELPLTWRQPRRVFVDSMSDLFHEAVPLEYIGRVFDVMRRSEQHQFQVLTKRSERLTELAPRLSWPKNVWMGVSVELDKYYNRIDDLRSVPAAVRFLSLEPLLGPMSNLPLEGIHWVIVGGESGPHTDLRLMDPAWVDSIRDQCVQAAVPFFFKQWGGRFKKKTGRLLRGANWDQYPRQGP
jgi:protein gp37